MTGSVNSVPSKGAFQEPVDGLGKGRAAKTCNRRGVATGLDDRVRPRRREHRCSAPRLPAGLAPTSAGCRGRGEPAPSPAVGTGETHSDRLRPASGGRGTTAAALSAARAMADRRGTGGAVRPRRRHRLPPQRRDRASPGGECGGPGSGTRPPPTYQPRDRADQDAHPLHGSARSPRADTEPAPAPRARRRLTQRPPSASPPRQTTARSASPTPPIPSAVSPSDGRPTTVFPATAPTSRVRPCSTPPRPPRPAPRSPNTTSPCFRPFSQRSRRRRCRILPLN